MTSSSLLEKSCLIGHPVAGNPTHYMIEQAIRQADSDWRFLTFEVEPKLLEDAIRGVRALGFRGIKIAEPFHEAVLPLLDELSEQARLAGSVNCVTLTEGKLVGHNTIGTAVVNLVGACRDVAGMEVVLLGAGRAGRSIAAALALAGARSLVVVDRSEARGEQLAGPLRESTDIVLKIVPWPEEPLPLAETTQLVVHATNFATMDPDRPLPLQPHRFPPHLIVADTNFMSPQSWLIAAARQLGIPAIDGLEILVEQTALALVAWSHGESDRLAMRDAAEEFLAL